MINGPRTLAEIVLSVLVSASTFAVAGLICSAARRSHASAPVLALALLATILMVAQTVGIVYALPCGVVAVEAYDWFFLPPLHHLNGAAFSVLGLLIAVAVIVGAVANTVSRNAVESARARGDLADEQAALRRVATLVGGGAAPAEVFAAIADELGRLFGAEASFMAKLDNPDKGLDDDVPTVTVVGSYGRTALTAPVGLTIDLQPGRLLHDALAAGAPVRADVRQLTIGPLGTLVVKLGIRSAIAAPIMVGSSAWGVTVAGTTRNLPPEAEGRILNFVELAAMAVHNAEARGHITRLVKVQQSLRRISLLIAQGRAPEHVFTAVTQEVRHHFTGGAARLLRYEPDGTVTLLAAHGSSEAEPVDPEHRDGLVETVARTGRPARVDRHGQISAVGLPINVSGRLWGLFTVDGHPGELEPGIEKRLEEFTDLIATAVADAQSRAELTNSRARIVAAADETRRGIERDLHDGIQQSLVALALRLRAAAADAADQSDLADAAASLTTVVDQLRELSHGIHPAVLSHSGLEAALRVLARRAPLTMNVDVRLDGRLPSPVEVGAYYIVSEALTNAVKHARASTLDVDAGIDDDVLTLRIRDDGIGGADPTRGTGLLGLRDRVQALGGSFDLRSPPDQGTTIACLIPLRGPNV
ncbi:GAF domain-containing protein [Actinoplanes sp. TBRC 11911]|uniref:GAF domain-containing sensor histidine kinase n=1 Tax=Actinoplanes sp. TBRC 11911 TaxID=2729386 RepID=UPI00289EF4B8|nr:GAF domain-containing protein [Actinoplanes sp. TBRC 11911]